MIAAETVAAARAAIPLSDLIGAEHKLARVGREHVALCPFHAERTPSFYVYADHFYCFGCGAHGDAIAWVMKTRGLSFQKAVEELAGEMEFRQQPNQPQIRPPPRQPCTADRFLRCWNEGTGAVGTIVETYLDSRGDLAIPTGADIRFHPHCQRGARDLPGGPDFWPAMLALMVDPLSGELVGVHRTYLRPDGTGKAPPVQRGTATLGAKRILGTWGMIRLAPADDSPKALGLAEGIENALTASQVLKWGPVQAAGARVALAKFPALPGFEAVTIFADGDEPGIAAANECADRWTKAGREALIQAPPAGLDWNAAVQSRSVAA